MFYKIWDKKYIKMIDKVWSREFVPGKDYSFVGYTTDGRTLEEYPIEERTPEICSYLMKFNNANFFDVPDSSRTREFFLNTFDVARIFKYVDNFPERFDKQFFKDLIATNKTNTSSKNNCFEVMNLEYIDEEMCTLALLNSTTKDSYNWFYTVAKRKPEVLTEDLWKLAARLYTDSNDRGKDFLSMTPEEYKDSEYYLEMCKCSYEYGNSYSTNKVGIMDLIPQEVITSDFVVALLNDSIENACNFNAKAFNTDIKLRTDHSEKAWQIILRKSGSKIQYMELDDEKIEFFLSIYSKDSKEYNYYFKNKYKKYISDRKIPSEKINLDSDKLGEEVYIPLSFYGPVPEHLSKEYDNEEYLKMLYNQLGITIVSEHEHYLYRAFLPKGWHLETDNVSNSIKDNHGNDVIEYFCSNKFYEQMAYVTKITIPEGKVMKKAI